MHSRSLRNRGRGKTASGTGTVRRSIRAPRGVSDIIGTILILGITVALFSTIFFFVSSLPGPSPQSNSQFVSILGVSAGGTESYLNITYKNGPILTTSEGVSVIISSTLHPSSFSCKNPYSLTAGLGTTSWSAGQIWTLHFIPGTTTCAGFPLTAAGDNLTVSISESSTNLLLYRATLPGNSAVTPPIFVSEAANPASPTVGNVFSINAVLQDPHPGSLQVTANLQGISATLTPWDHLALQNGYWTVDTMPSGGTTVPLLLNSPLITAGVPYSISLTANDTTDHLSNSAVFQITFSTTQVGVQTAVISLSISLSNSVPRVHQGIEVMGTVRNAGPGTTGSVTDVSIRAVFASGGSIQIMNNAVVAAYLSPQVSQTVQQAWAATANFNPTVFKPGSVTFEGWANCTTAVPSTVTGLLNVTVFPRTLLVDETGSTPGLNGSLDTFTWLETDFSSAGIPYNTTVDQPGSGTVIYTGTGPDSLDMYDVVLWVVSDQGAMTSSEASYLVQYLQGGAALWLVGENALNSTGLSGCTATIPAGLTTLAGDLGVSAETAHCNALKASGSTVNLLVSNAGPVPSTYVDNTAGNLELSGTLDSYLSHPTYYTMTASGGNTYLSTSGAALSIDYAGLAGGAKSMVSTFELADVSQTLGGVVSTSTSQQAAIVYNVFNWLAGFSTLNPTRDSDDWGVSQVVVEPAQLQFNTPATVYFTIRNNGPDSGSFTVDLDVDNSPAYYQGSLIATTIAVNPLGGEVNGSFNWVPTFLGYVTVSVCINPPATDSDAGNNCMGNSLFSQQIYVHYSVLLVDGTSPATAGNSNDTYLLYNDLEADGFPASTITEASLSFAIGGGHLATGCGTLPVAVVNDLIGTSSTGSGRPQYNMVVWNAGNTNATGIQAGNCALSPYNAGLLETFLGLGGSSSSLLYIGDGLLQEAHSAATQPDVAEKFASAYLGFSDTAAGTKITGASVKSLFGGVNDPVGDGIALPYPAAPNGNYSFATLTPTSGLTVRASFNFTSTDFWTPSSPASYAATDTYAPVLGWHAAYWAFNVPAVSSVKARGGNQSGASQIQLALLRASTFFGRLLAQPDVVVGPTDITFSTTSASWIDFDQMHPQIQEQYLITANVTNLGGLEAYDVIVNIMDGDHILGSQTVTVGPASSSAAGLITPGVAQISTSWTPLYGATNPINVTLVSGTAGDTLPGIGSYGTSNVTVYFFYDNGVNNANDWTHNDLVTWDGDDNEALSPPVGQQPYYQDDSNIPDGYNDGELYGAGTAGQGTWGLDTDTCYENLWVCQSNVIVDPSDNVITTSNCGGHHQPACTTDQGDVAWVESSAITLTGGESSASASWWQAYVLAPFETGGVVCVAPGSTTCSGSGTTNFASATTTTAGLVNPSPGYTGNLQWDYTGSACQQTLNAFTNANTGLTYSSTDPTGYTPDSWQFETVNLTQWIPATSGATTTVTVYFGLVGGYETSCGGTAIASTGGWWIDQFNAYVSGGPLTPVTEGTASGAGCGATFGSYIPDDTWDLGTKGTVDAFGVSGLPTGSQGAWVDAANNSGKMTLNPNMWDSLYSRSIDLTSAANATLTFNYVWSRITPNMDPPQGFIVQVSPVLPNGVVNWIQVWNGNFLSSGAVDTTNYQTTWQSATVNLAGYVGEVIQIRFLVGTNCGGDGDDNTLINYPTQGGQPNGATQGSGNSGAILSGVYVSGATTLSAGNPLAPAAVHPMHPSDVVGQPTWYAHASSGLVAHPVGALPAMSLATIESGAQTTSNIVAPGHSGAARWA